MSLDLGELRANVVIDQGQVPRGLAAVRRKWQDFTRGMTTDAKRAGGDAGGALGNGMSSRLPRGLTAVQRRVEAFWGRLRSGSAKAGEDAGESTSRGMVSRLSGGLRRGVGGLGKVIGGGGSMLGTVALGGAGVLAGLGAAGVAALGAVGVAGAIAGTKVASGNEQAAISFETMLGSATKADRFLRDLQKFAAETPFEFPELQSAASSLISAGINADKVIPIMRTLGDVTSGMGTGSEGVKRATIALQQMSAAGRITGEDLNQLRDAGIPVFDLLAKATGKSKEEVVKLAQSGKLGKKELGQMMQALESGKGLERFSGLMEKQSKSLSGMWSTLKDTVGQGLAGIMSNALPLMKEGLEQVSGAAARLFGWFNNNQDSIGRLFKSGQRALSLFGKVVSTVFGAFIKSTGDGTDTVERLANFLDTHQAEMTAVFMALAKFALQGADAMAVLTSATLRGLAFILENVFKVRGSIQELFGGMLEQAAKAFGWVPGLGPKLSAASELFKELGRSSKDGSKKMADGMRSAADGIDNSLRPGLRAAQRELDKLASTEISKAALRDSAARSKILIASIGTEADGSQVKLKKFADISKLAADRQKALKTRLSDATSGLKSQLTAMEKAGAGQEALTKAWKKGRDRLYDEFKQMGLSNKEAKKLADRYAGVKPKVETKFTTPGLKGASADTKTYVDRQGKIDKSKTTSVSVKWGSSGKVALKRGGSMTYIADADGSSGVLRGYTPGRDPYHFTSETPGVPDLKLSGGEGIMRPEVVRALGESWVDRVNRAAKMGGVGAVQRAVAFADGGIPTFGRANNATKPAHSAGSVVAANAAGRINSEAVKALKKLEAAAKAASGSAGGGSFLGGRKPVPGGGKKHSGYGWASWAGDFPNATGTKVGAWAAGKVTAVNRWNRSYGNHVRIDHGKWRTLYAHMSSIAVSKGSTVKAGNVVGRVGSTGNSTGPHLHFEKYDTGGRLRPGWTVAYNGTGKNETVRTHEQERALAGRRGPTIGTVNLHTSDRARDAVGELEYALARIENGGPHE